MRNTLSYFSMNLLITIILALVAVAMMVWAIRNVVVGDELAERREELDKYSVYLDERANNLAMLEQTILAPPPISQAPVFTEGWEELSAVYCVSESDLVAFKSEKAIAAKAKKHCAKLIADAIVNSQEPIVEGNKYTYKIRVRK